MTLNDPNMKELIEKLDFFLSQMPDGLKSNIEIPAEWTGNMSLLMPYFQKTIVEVQREEFAYPPISLVADVGGVLGLFIGFNFLMIWDWIVMGLQKFCTKNN